VTNNLLNEEARKKGGITVQFEANFVGMHGRTENYRRNKGRDKSRGDPDFTLK